MRADPLVSPVAGAAVLAMLAFSLAAGALLVQLNFTLQQAPALDRHADPVRQAKLARGLGWLNQAVRKGGAGEPASAPDCTSKLGSAQFECGRSRLNQRLALADPPVHLAAATPDAASLPDVLAATRWLLLYSDQPSNLHALLQRGEEAATHSLPDPFRLSGCVGWAAAAAPCDAAAAATARRLLPHAGHLFNGLSQYVAASRGQSPNLQMLHAAPGLDTPITQGRHLALSLDPAVQELAQATAACFSGDAAACLRCHWCNRATASDMFEQARARAVGILVLDARSGAIEAAASGYSLCYLRQQQGEPAEASCPQLPTTQLPHPERLGNQALEQSAKPGSITKIVIALGLQQAGLSASESAELPRILTHSRTLDLIDIAMCKKQGFDPACAQRRLVAVADMARSVGWDRWTDVLSAAQLPGLRAQRFSARLLSLPDGSPMISPGEKVEFTSATLSACSRRQWRNCKGQDLVNLVAELFGTGEALASPVGVANVLLHLAAASNQQARVAQVHLVTMAQDGLGHAAVVQPALAPLLGRAQAALVLSGLERTAAQGTARSACLAAALALPGGQLPCVIPAGEPGRALLRIAGKTGTPVFSADQGESKSLSLDQWRAQCGQVRRELAAMHKGQARWHGWANEAGKCNMVPTKWYAFLVGAPGGQGWDKVVVVLAERNWNQRTGLIDSPNDRGPNVAAEAGLSLVNALYHPAPDARTSGPQALAAAQTLP